MAETAESGFVMMSGVATTPANRCTNEERVKEWRWSALNSFGSCLSLAPLNISALPNPTVVQIIYTSHGAAGVEGND
jgi:hypothetical protein